MGAGMKRAFAAAKETRRRSAQIAMVAVRDELEAPLRARIAELETAAKKALRHADKNGMGDWPAFAALRKAIAKSTQ